MFKGWKEQPLRVRVLIAGVSSVRATAAHLVMYGGRGGPGSGDPNGVLWGKATGRIFNESGL